MSQEDRQIEKIDNYLFADKKKEEGRYGSKEEINLKVKTTVVQNCAANEKKKEAKSLNVDYTINFFTYSHYNL